MITFEVYDNLWDSYIASNDIGVFTTEEGMTWQEFLESDYNVANWFYDGSGIGSATSLSHDTKVYLRKGTQFVTLNEIISESKWYDWDGDYGNAV